MPMMMYNGVPYGGGQKYIELTQAEYDALEVIEADTLYFITDGQIGTDAGMGNTDISGIGDGTVTGAIGALDEKTTELVRFASEYFAVPGNTEVFIDFYPTIPNGYKPLTVLPCQTGALGIIYEGCHMETGLIRAWVYNVTSSEASARFVCDVLCVKN